MTIEILSTGEEIRSGAIIDTNAAFISQLLEDAGLPVTRHLSVGDDSGLLVSVFKEISQRAQVAIVTGGLGPTQDDLTTEAAAEAARKKLFLNKNALESIENYFHSKNRQITTPDQKQAYLPEGAQILDNPIGTAPGFEIKIGSCTFFCMPGVPREMKKMIKDIVLPRIIELLGHTRIEQESITYSVYGLSEALVGERVNGLIQKYQGLRIGLRADFPVIYIKLSFHHSDSALAKEVMASSHQWIYEALGDKVFSARNDSMADVVGRLLRQNQATLALAESCTGGLIANWVTDAAGSSDYFLFSGVTYANAAKSDILGVPAALIDQVGAVHEDTAKAMAQGARHAAKATFGLATSGIAGPDGGTADKPVGTVCIGLATEQKAAGFRYHFPYRSRSMNKKVFAMQALDLLRRELQQVNSR
jgi:nicotinamide-nucleotide amidase